MSLQDSVRRVCGLPQHAPPLCASPRRGAGYALTVIALPMLLGVAALAIDLGLMSVAAERVQHVADLSALAGATCGTDESGSVALADETATTNNAFSDWQVDTVVTTFGPGQEVPGYRTLGLREHVTDVTATTEFEFAFARIFGLEGATIVRRSAALSEVWRNRLADGFIFAGETDPAVTGVYVEGSRCSFNGSIHSNTCMSLSGSSMSVTGDIRYRNHYERSGPLFSHDGELSVTPITQYPVDVTWDDFDRGPWDHEVAEINVRDTGVSLPSGRWHVLGDMIINGTDFSCHDSLFVVEGRIYINCSAPVLDGVTLVAREDIYFNGADGRFSPYLNDIFAFTPMASTANTIFVNAARCDASGIMFAPEGRIYFNGSSEITYEVGLVARTIGLEGSDSTHMGPVSAYTADETSRAKLVL